MFQGVMHIHYIYLGPVIIMVVTSLMYVEVGWPSLLALIALLLVPLKVYLGRLISDYR